LTEADKKKNVRKEKGEVVAGEEILAEGEENGRFYFFSGEYSTRKRGCSANQKGKGSIRSRKTCSPFVPLVRGALHVATLKKKTSRQRRTGRER